MPEHYKDMQAHQKHCALQQTWWLHKQKPPVATQVWPFTDEDYNSSALATVPAGVAAVDIQDQLSAAMSSSIVFPEADQADPPVSLPHWQTSETHPIVCVSTLLRSVLLKLISP